MLRHEGQGVTYFFNVTVFAVHGGKLSSVLSSIADEIKSFFLQKGKKCDVALNEELSSQT
jgi:hypothetical protein